MGHKRLLVSVLTTLLVFSSFSETVKGSSYKRQAAPSSLLIAFTSNRTGDDDIFVINPDGSGQDNLTDNDAEDFNPVWSPDGSTIAFTSDRDGSLDIFIMDSLGDNAQNLTEPNGNAAFRDTEATWSPESDRIIFVSDRPRADGQSGLDELWMITLPTEENPTVGAPVQLTNDGIPKGEPAWSPDGTTVAYWATHGDYLQIFTCKLNGQQCTNATRLTREGNNTWPRWSSKYQIAFESERETNFEVRIMDIAGSGQRSYGGDPIAADGRPAWSPEGDYIVYNSNRTGNDELYIMSSDGSNIVQLTDEPYADHSPSWQPKVPEIREGASTESDDTPALTDDPSIVQEGGKGNIGRSAERPLTAIVQQYNIGEWHAAGWEGDDVAVGVIDHGFRGLFELEDWYAAADLRVTIPPNHSKDDYDGNPATVRHGTHVLEVIHEVAPNANLYACRYQTFEDFEACVQFMYDSGVKVINHSAGVPALPLNGRNKWATIASEALQRDVIWVNSAGNFRDGSFIDNWRDAGRWTNGVFSPEPDGYFERSISDPDNEKFKFESGLLDEVGGIYNYSMFLSWSGMEASGITAEQLDFDIEIYDLATDQQLATVDTSHTGTTPPQSFERWPSPVIDLREITQPFYLKIRYKSGIPLSADMQISLFVSFATVAGSTPRMQSVIAPADSQFVLTVGATRDDLPAPYSSNGVDNPQYSKPDLLAPGEFFLHDGTSFIGTSAAAPVIAGIAALYWEFFGEASASQVVTELVDGITDGNIGKVNNEVGYGVLQMPAPFNADQQTLDAEAVLDDSIPVSIYPLPGGGSTTDVTVAACTNGLPQRLKIGSTAYMLRIPGPDIINVRSGPGSQATKIAELVRSDQFTVIGGPECSADGVSRWQIELADGSNGWIAEGTNYYFVAPVSLTEATLPPWLDTLCPNAPPTKFVIGDTAIVAPEVRLRLTSQPSGSGNSSDNIDVVLEGTRLRILTGPACSASGDEWRWYVRDLETTFEGWASEGEPGDVWMCPEANPNCN